MQWVIDLMTDTRCQLTDRGQLGFLQHTGFRLLNTDDTAVPPTLMALVPADAYGHGAVAVGTTALHNGATYLGVDTFEEAVALRVGGIDAPILVLGYVPPHAVRDAIRFDLTLTVTNIDPRHPGCRCLELN